MNITTRNTKFSEMGDRGNIGIRQPHEEATIFLYTHWGGSGICHILSEGLRKCKQEGRLDDPACATRIIFDTLTGLRGGSTGYGISVGSPCDNEHEIPFVVWERHGDPIIHYGCGRFTPEDWMEAHGVPKSLWDSQTE